MVADFVACKVQQHGRRPAGKSGFAANTAGMVILPRIARFLGHPGVASILGVILIAAGILGFATDDISRGWALLIIAVGVINVVHGVSERRAES